MSRPEAYMPGATYIKHNNRWYAVKNGNVYKRVAAGPGRPGSYRFKQIITGAAHDAVLAKVK